MLSRPDYSGPRPKNECSFISLSLSLFTKRLHSNSHEEKLQRTCHEVVVVVGRCRPQVGLPTLTVHWVGFPPSGGLGGVPHGAESRQSSQSSRLHYRGSYFTHRRGLYGAIFAFWLLLLLAAPKKVPREEPVNSVRKLCSLACNGRLYRPAIESLIRILELLLAPGERRPTGELVCHGVALDLETDDAGKVPRQMRRIQCNTKTYREASCAASLRTRWTAR